MAITTRRYIEGGPSNGQLRKFVDASLNVVERFKSPVCEIEYDDSLAGMSDAIDDFMEALGYRPDDGSLEYDVIARPGAPATVVGRVRMYSRTIAGITQLFAKADDGTVTQLTPAQVPDGFITGMVPSYTSPSQVTISAGLARNNTGQRNVTLAAPVVVDITIAGAGGLDAGVEAANTWYFIFVISDSTGVLPTVGLLSASAGAPTLPAGYDTRRRVGSVRNNAALDFRDFQVSGTGVSRSVQYRDAISTRQRLTGGAAVAVTAVSCGQLIPITSSFARFQIQQRGAVAAMIYDDPAQLLANAQRNVFAGGSIYDVLRVSAGRDIAYANAAAGGLLDVWVTGYEESI